MITVKTGDEIQKLRAGGRRLAWILKTLSEKIVPGISAAELNDYALKLAGKGRDQPAFLNYKSPGGKQAFPAALCVSINDEIVHGIPVREKIVKGGDLVSLDLGLIHEGFYTDAAITIAVGKVSEKARRLLRVTEEALYAGIRSIRSGGTTGDIGAAIEKSVTPYNLGIIRELAGHGVGYALHEDPYIPNYGKSGEGVFLKTGMVIAIEPMLTLGAREIALAEDGFTYKTKDGSLAAHFEHTVAVTEAGAEILTKL